MTNKLDEKYQALLQHILSNGSVKEDRTGTGTLSVFGYEFRHNMQDGFPLLTTKKMFLRGIAVELEWFLRGDTNIKYLVDRGVNIWVGDAYKNYLKSFNKPFQLSAPLDVDGFIDAIKNNNEFAQRYGNLGPVYGHQWRHRGAEFISPDGTTLIAEANSDVGIDQIAEALKMLKNDPDGRRILVNAWNPAETQYMVLPPCHIGFQFYTRTLTLTERVAIYFKKNPTQSFCSYTTFLDAENIPQRGISLKWEQRSCDVALGLPFNIASYGLLLMIFANQLNMEPLELIGSLGDTHIYKNHVDQCKIQIARSHFDLPTLKIWKDTTIDNFEWAQCTLENYQSHGTLKMDLSN